MNKKELALKLSRLKILNKYDVDLEQYQTQSEVAADILWRINFFSNIKGKIVADFGCGNGVLGIGCLLLNAKNVYFVDKDKNAIDITKENCKRFKNVEFVNKDVFEFSKKVDMVVMNPPFGVQKKKADKKFLEKAMGISKYIFSIHKIESKGFINKLCKENDFRVKNIIEFKFPLVKSYKFHRKKLYYVDVGLWIIEKLK